jgi:hypothetical protein
MPNPCLVRGVYLCRVRRGASGHPPSRRVALVGRSIGSQSALNQQPQPRSCSRLADPYSKGIFTTPLFNFSQGSDIFSPGISSLQEYPRPADRCSGWERTRRFRSRRRLCAGCVRLPSPRRAAAVSPYPNDTPQPTNSATQLNFRRGRRSRKSLPLHRATIQLSRKTQLQTAITKRPYCYQQIFYQMDNNNQPQQQNFPARRSYSELNHNTTPPQNSQPQQQTRLARRSSTRWTATQTAR